MICKNCFSEMDESAKYCQTCGAAVENHRSPQSQKTVARLGAAPKPASSLVWGILGTVFGCSIILSFLGIIFSSVGFCKAKKYEARGSMPSGKNKTGKILSIVGLSISILMTVSLVFPLGLRAFGSIVDALTDFISTIG